MFEKVPRRRKSAFVLFVVFLTLTIQSSAQRPAPTPAGEQTFIARSLPEFRLDGIRPGGPGDLPGMQNSFEDEGIVAVAAKTQTCFNAKSKKTEIVTKSLSYLYLDQEKLDSTLTVNQRGRSGSVKLEGTVRLLEAESFDEDCDPVNVTETSGAGGLDLAFQTKNHATPRNFLITTATGRVYGPGLNESLRMPSTGTPYRDQGISSDTSYLKEIVPNAGKLDPALLEKYGVKLPPDVLEMIKKNQTDSVESRFYGTVNSPQIVTGSDGKVPQAIVHFFITSGFEADMLVYKPEAMASAGGGTAKMEDGNLSEPNGYFRKAGYSLTGDLFENERFPNRYLRQTPVAGGIFIPKRDREKVQAFVNLDNDDKNENFDLDDTEKLADRDNDLVKVVLRIKEKPRPQRKGTAGFTVEKGGEYVRVWERDGDTEKLKEYRPRDLSEADENEFRTGTGKFAGFLIKELWIEGKKAQSNQKQTKFKFTYFENPRSIGYGIDEEFELTVIGIDWVLLEAQDNGAEFDDDRANEKFIVKPSAVLDTDPNHKNPSDAPNTSSLKPKGVRVFPGKRLLNTLQRDSGCNAKITNNLDGEPRDKVTVKAILSVAPVAPVKLYFDSFDVDDPTAAGNGNPKADDNDSEAWIDDESNASDNRGRIEGATVKPHAGRFPGEDQKEGILEVEFTEKEKTFPFQVTMQPGDNFRIVGSGSRDFFENLENDDQKLNTGGPTAANENKQRIVDRFVLNSKSITQAEIREPEKYASNTLSIWRIFYAERDHMKTVEKNSVEGQIAEISYNLFRTQSIVKLNQNFRKYYDLTVELGLANSFEKGKLTINGTSYDVLSNTADSALFDSVTVSGKLPQTLVNAKFTLSDDDKVQHPNFEDGKELWNPNISNRTGPYRNGVDQRFMPAYIVGDFGTLKNPCPNPPFAVNVKADTSVSYKSHYRFDNIATHDSKDFWTVYVLGAFQATSWEDGDPNAEGEGQAGSGKSGITAGIIDDDGIGATIFLAGVIEKIKGDHGIITVAGRGEQDAVVHEIGHLFNAQHEQGKLMDQKDLVFSRRSIKAIRDAKNP
jgi:hypothetical protein